MGMLPAIETPAQALRRAVALIGSQTNMGRALGISQAAVSKWLKGGAVLPAEHVLRVEAHTGISRHELRPDLYPLEGPAADPGAAGGGPGIPNPARPSDHQMGEPVA